MELLLLVYIAAGYWAVPRTIYKNRVVYTTQFNWFCSRLIWGTLLGIVLIPWAIISKNN